MKTTKKNFDFAGLPSARILANFIRWKCLPFGYLERGPGIVWLLSIWMRHAFGRQLATLQIKHQKHFNRAIALLRRVRGLLRSPQS